MIKKIFLFILSALTLLNAQKEERIVAKAGSCIIYESEFKERFDFSSHPRLLQKSDKLEAKRDFLHQLIAEKLLSLEARYKGCDTSEVFRDLMMPLENMFIRDALYTLEIKNKINYSQDEINEGISRINKLLKVKFLYSKGKEEIENLYLLLQKGSSFDSLLSLRKEVKDQKFPREITFGTMDKSVEDQIYNLKTGEFSKPVESEDGYYILKLVAVDMNPALKNQELTGEEVKRIVQKRAEFKRYKEYRGNILSDEKVTADRTIFNALASFFVKAFQEKYSSADNEVINKCYLIGPEVGNALYSLEPETIVKPFIELENTVSLKLFLNQLGQEGFYVKDKSELSIRSSLSSYIRKFIEDQILTAEGERYRLDNSFEVKKYTAMWKDYYLSKILMMEIFDSIKVSHEEAYSLYKKNQDLNFRLPLVNIAEVLTDSLRVVETVLNELAQGKSIKELAEKYTKRDTLKDKGGEFGYFPITKYGELGKIASRMSIGEVYGPLKLDEGYSVFQLLDKKEDTANYKMDYADIKEQIIMMLILEKYEKYINEYNARLALKYGVKINDDVLKDIENSYLNMIVVRYMGFGGEIYAVPYTEQYSGWYKIWQKNQNAVP